MNYPFFIMAELLKTKILSHQKEIIDNDKLYDSLYYISDMLERWHGNQYEKENDKCNTTHYFAKQVYLDYTKRIGKYIEFDSSKWLVIDADSQGKSPYWKVTLQKV